MSPTTPTTPALSPVLSAAPASPGPTPPTTTANATPNSWLPQFHQFFEPTDNPRWANRLDKPSRSAKHQFIIDHDDQINQQTNHKTTWTVLKLFLKALTMIILFSMAAPLAHELLNVTYAAHTNNTLVPSLNLTAYLNMSAVRHEAIDQIRFELFDDVRTEYQKTFAEEIRAEII